jgi:hypothetical protein
MPVIHQKPWAPDASRHPDLLRRLVAELNTPSEFGQPLLWVRTFERSGLRSVAAVWDAWEQVDFLDRVSVILKAYEEVSGVTERDRIGTAVGYTEPEAVEAGVLPFAVVPLLRKTDPAGLRDGCRQAMLDLGASDLWKKGFPRLRLPTEELANRYLDELARRVPGSDGVWSIERDLHVGV